jgi:hypothetical protein
MSARSTRRIRILRVRQLEHRLATAKLRSADAALKNLHNIAQRIATLRASLRPDGEETSGLELKALFEMSSRLENARDGLTLPIAQAEEDCDQFDKLRLAARMREDGATKLRDKAVHHEAAKATLRADANRPPRRFGKRGSDQ